MRKRPASPPLLRKAPTGIAGLDEITGGGLPYGRPSLICGGPGCGKTLMAMEFLVRGAVKYGEPGVFIAFEEREEELNKNVASLGFDLPRLTAEKKLLIDHVRIERSEIEETGAYDLEGLFIRLGCAIDAIKAKRVAMDTIESLFSGLLNTAILRSELRRLFHWLKDRGVTAVITGERGEGALTRQGLEEYVSDCVILLDHRMSGEVSTRRLRIVKYRGSTHGTNEYPFLIDSDGVSVLPITSMDMTHKVSLQRMPTGIARLDAMLGGKGFYRGSSVLISGPAGTGKTSLALTFAAAAGKRKERCLYFGYEESEAQIIRNMRSIGLDLGRAVKDGYLKTITATPATHGLEMHLVMMHKLVAQYHPKLVIVDPITSLLGAGATAGVNSLLLRLVDFLRAQFITAVFTNLTASGRPIEDTDLGVSSLMDSWILLRDLEAGGERNRALYVLKSRGMAHSNQVREFLLTDHGIELVDVYLGPSGVLAGSARLNQEAKELNENATRQRDIEARERVLMRKRLSLDAQIEALKGEIEIEASELAALRAQEADRKRLLATTHQQMSRSRKADTHAHPVRKTIRTSRSAP